MIKLFKKKAKKNEVEDFLQMNDKTPDPIVCQSVLIVDGQEVYHKDDVVALVLKDGTVHVGRIDDIVLAGMYMNGRSYMTLDESSKFNKNDRLIYIEEITFIKLAEEI